MIYRTVMERELIGYGNDDNTIPEEDARRIEEVVQKSSLSKKSKGRVLRREPDGLRARGIVGVISTSTCQLEILPKIDEGDSDDIRDSERVARRHLIHMLATTEELGIVDGERGQIGLQGGTLLEILISLFCDSVDHAIRNGLPCRYFAIEDNLPALRGRLDVIRQFSFNAAYPQRIACQFDVLSHDTPLNRVIRSTIVKLLKVSQSHDNQRRLRRLGMIYASVGCASEEDLREGESLIDRLTSDWRISVLFARLFLLGQYQDTSTGDVEGWTFLFEMSTLFEKYIGFRTTQALSHSGMILDSRLKNRKCLYDANKKFRETKPDIIVTRDGKPVYIIDAKWKMIKQEAGRVVNDIARSDLYQMITYCKVYNCSSIVILYPHNRKIESDRIRETYAISDPNSDSKLTIATIDITDSVNRQIEILKGLFE